MSSDRHERDERIEGEFVSVLQPASQPPRTYADEDIVKGRPERVLHLLHFIERQMCEYGLPMRGDRNVERGARRAQGRRHAGLDPTSSEREPGHRAERLRHDGRPPQRAPGSREHPAQDQLYVGRSVVGVPVVPGLGPVRPLGREVEEMHHEVRARHSVDRAVMHLHDEADAPVADALDDPELPEWPGPVQRPAGDVGGHASQLGDSARLRAARPADVVVEVDV